ncbi:EF-hand domain-containing protein [Aurantimonas sp. C2-6-R+9]|uniref:EF-hand domain-containing protein n=1 Tax=unclassified Aurantimonas TaxID=2638230 RepID=UPI002E19B4CC|nr:MULTISPECIES: EF-hand domain-containing protein [unclassified Aurantimonas]MEC5290060.1 EF-hand domain-containing protein [Aurantimonas sp. C2-3-R2]MEC5381824.1 EF-hand domain-containing protein [Aurantimonas sp. C2-6-R+9]MEC5411125.1 EF-hand domain-containing protein [Aurantimonas sp. C2-4-R8]
MFKSILALTTSALILAGSAMAAKGDQDHGATGQQDRTGKMMQQQDDDMMRPGGQRSERDDDDLDERWGMRGGMMGSRMGGAHMMRMMMILLDIDGDGALSLDEVQAVHARFFKAVDADANGKVTIEEMQVFMSPMGGRPGRQ